MAVTIVELDAAGVRVRLDALAELLLDAHESGMALGLAAPLSREDARDAYERAAARLAPGERLLLAALEGGEVVGAVQLDRAEAENGRHRAEVRRLAVRRDRRGAGIGRALMDAAVSHAQALGLRLLWLSTHEGTAADRAYGRLGWTRAGVIPDYAVLPSGELAANAFYFLRLGNSD
jgi:ribosomal protein S18 acetylase RimI-like enzyme